MSDFKKVTKEEFDVFIKNYPRKLEADFYMDMVTYNDFTIADEYPESIVAKHDTWDDDYYIIEEVKL